MFFDDTKPNLADPARALENSKLYLSATEEMVQRDPNDRSAQRSRAIAMYRDSLPLSLFDPDADLKIASGSVRVFDQFIVSGKNDSVTLSFRATALQRLAKAQLAAGRLSDARNSAESALAAERSLAAGLDAESDEAEDLVMALILAGQTNAASGAPERAESLLQDAREKARSYFKPRKLMSAIPLETSEKALGDFYQTRHRNLEARACYQELAALWGEFTEPNEYVVRQGAVAEQFRSSIR